MQQGRDTVGARVERGGGGEGDEEERCGGG